LYFFLFHFRAVLTVLYFLYSTFELFWLFCIFLFHCRAILTVLYIYFFHFVDSAPLRISSTGNCLHGSSSRTIC
jgi:hypothetical protein